MKTSRLRLVPSRPRCWPGQKVTFVEGSGRSGGQRAVLRASELETVVARSLFESRHDKSVQEDPADVRASRRTMATTTRSVSASGRSPSVGMQCSCYASGAATGTRHSCASRSWHGESSICAIGRFERATRPRRPGSIPENEGGLGKGAENLGTPSERGATIATDTSLPPRAPWGAS